MRSKSKDFDQFSGSPAAMTYSILGVSIHFCKSDVASFWTENRIIAEAIKAIESQFK